MVRVQLNFVIIALVNEKLRAGCDRKHIRVTPYEIRTWGRTMEVKTGMAVLNGFFPDSILQFLDHCSLFYPDYGEKDCEGNPSYILNVEALSRISAYPDIAYCLLLVWDPVLNYPMEFIEASGMISVLEGSENSGR